MDIQQEKGDGVTIVALQGRIDGNTSRSLEEALTKSLDQGERRLVLDMTEVEYITSAGLRVVLVLAKRLAASKGNLVVCSLSEPVRQIFEIAGFLPLIAVSTTRALAIEKVQEPV